MRRKSTVSAAATAAEKYILLDHSNQEYGIRVRAERTRAAYLNPERIWAMMIADPEKTRRQLKCAGVLYHQITSAVHFNQFHRAAIYLVAFHSYCVRYFGDNKIQTAKLLLEQKI